MSKDHRPITIYKYRGMIERGSPNKGYRWTEGYSPDGRQGGVTYPWMTYRECQLDAKAHGCRAVFLRANESVDRGETDE